MDDTEKILRERIENSPEAIRELIASNELLAGIRQIAIANKLTAEQMRSLESEVIFVLVGIELYKDFKENIDKELGVSGDVSQNISDTIEREIFDKVIDYLPKEKEDAPQNNEEPVYNLGSQEAGLNDTTENKWWETTNEERGSVGEITNPNPLPGIPQQDVLAPNNLPGIPQKNSPQTVRDTNVRSVSVGAKSNQSVIPETPTPIQKPTSNQAQSIIDETLSRLSKDEEEWERRKHSLGSEDRVVKSDYSQGEDPYREIPS